MAKMKWHKLTAKVLLPDGAVEVDERLLLSSILTAFGPGTTIMGLQVMLDDPVAEKARRNVLGIEIPRDELAWRIAEQCLGVRPTMSMTATAKLDALADANPHMVQDFRKAADAAAMYFAECVNNGRPVQ